MRLDKAKDEVKKELDLGEEDIVNEFKSLKSDWLFTVKVREVSMTFFHLELFDQPYYFRGNGFTNSTNVKIESGTNFKKLVQIAKKFKEEEIDNK